MNGTFIFGARTCMKWKLIGAIKNQNGFPGFLPPYQTRYLTLVVTNAVFQTFDGSPRPDLGGTTTTTIDRLTGAATFSGLRGNIQQYPYGVDTTQNPPWQSITDNSFVWTFSNDEFYGTVTAQLSNPYTLAQLDADANALITAIDPAKVDWDTLEVNQYAEISRGFGGNFRDALPAQALAYMPNIYGPGPVFIPTLTSAAWYVYAYGGVDGTEWFPNGYMKMTAWIALAGNYCQKTFIVDVNLNQLSQTCTSGTGSCASPFNVQPPPLIPGQNAYIQIIPNCQCGG